jgi:hypothetical protein
MYQNGRDVARLGAPGPTAVRRLLGIPRYLWREAIVDASHTVGRSLTGDTPGALAAALRTLWFCGYIRESWLGDRRRRVDYRQPPAAVRA